MRGLIVQAVLLAAIAFALAGLVRHVMSEQGASGFSFLNTTAGFDIIQHLVPYSETSTYGRVLLVGLLNTLLVAVLGIVFATILGFAIGIGQLSSNWLVAKLCVSYVELLRNVPLLLQIFFWYFAVLRALPGPRESFNPIADVFINNRGVYVPRPEAAPEFVWVGAAFLVGVVGAFWLRGWARDRRELTGQRFNTLPAASALVVLPPLLVGALTGFPLSFSFPELEGFNFVGGLVIIPELIALVVALSAYTATYIAEAVRAGISGVAGGQREAALALGLTRGQMLRLVVVPQAMRQIVPPLTSQYLNLTKNSSLAVAIAYPDLVSIFAGTTLNQSGHEVEVIAITMGVYLSLSLITSALMNWYNARIALTER
ncbi:MAG: ABC transporter permease subunit [Alphaproteobacteria bacterium]|nr:ABC transporter permease subunit [Alphaproteobacteria bacterium]